MVVLYLTLLLQLCTAHKPTNDRRTWKTINHPKIKFINPSTFTITTPPATDLWRPNITADNFTAPYLYTTCKSSSFKSISVTVSADWKTRYDQGGIAIFFPEPDHGKHKEPSMGRGTRCEK